MVLKHHDDEGQASFVTFSTRGRIPLLTNRIFQQVVVDTIAEVRVMHRFKLLAYVIMPEHVHLVCMPTLESKLGLIIGEVKRISAKKIHEMLLKSASPILDRPQAQRDGVTKYVLWKRRCYDHNCRTEDSLWEKVNYCHNNPVKRGLVRKPGDWEWSSAGWYEGRRDYGLKIDYLQP